MTHSKKIIGSYLHSLLACICTVLQSAISVGSGDLNNVSWQYSQLKSEGFPFEVLATYLLHFNEFGHSLWFCPPPL